MKEFMIGQLADLGNVSHRTLRYYDKIGLLKPSQIASNGYRQYNEKDLVRLQKILLLKKLGFSLEEIEGMLLEKDPSWIDSLKEQIGLVDQKIQYFQLLKETIRKTIEIVDRNGMSVEKTVQLLEIISKDDQLVEQYKNSKNLHVRIRLHHLYSTNPIDWFSWLKEQIDFSKGYRVLELGVGNGDLWIEPKVDLRNREIFLSDISEGMLEDAKKRLSDDFSFMQIDAQNIPFKKDFFDIVIANHVLFYLNDLSKGLNEISRVLKKGGIFYASTYSKNHMKEITDLAKEFDSRIQLSQNVLPDVFGKENGESLLKSFFSEVERKDYNDTLVIDQAKPIVDYIISCHGNQNEILSGHVREFYQFVEDKIKAQGAITVTKEACLFIAKK
ncbi:MerR family transcriptional regulator [Dubosiella newyorkensis]|uniref:MerR family transcriptional regulator n=2 Tax=Dubosiella newyorkensis TaxID=1862672 RepID=UPI00272B9AA7|nr:MerR family transcriptional regulator [Dubosiella newyorkensis]